MFPSNPRIRRNRGEQRAPHSRRIYACFRVHRGSSRRILFSREFEIRTEETTRLSSLVTFPRAPRFALVSLFPSRKSNSYLPLLPRYVSRWHHSSRIVDPIYLRLLFASRFRHSDGKTLATSPTDRKKRQFFRIRRLARSIEPLGFLVIEEDDSKQKEVFKRETVTRSRVERLSSRDRWDLVAHPSTVFPPSSNLSLRSRDPTMERIARARVCARVCARVYFTKKEKKERKKESNSKE